MLGLRSILRDFSIRRLFCLYTGIAGLITTKAHRTQRSESLNLRVLCGAILVCHALVNRDVKREWTRIISIRVHSRSFADHATRVATAFEARHAAPRRSTAVSAHTCVGRDT